MIPVFIWCIPSRLFFLIGKVRPWSVSFLLFLFVLTVPVPPGKFIFIQKRKGKRGHCKELIRLSFDIDVGRNVNGGSLEITSMSGQVYPPDTMNGRSSAILVHPSSMQHHHFHPHLHPPPIQSMQGHNYHPQASISSYRNPTSNTLSHGTLNPYLDGLESGHRYPRPVPSNGLRIYRPHRSGMRQTAQENSNHPHLRVLSEDEVAILEIPGFYEVGNLIDQHRDMRLDIDDMSYEELLALGERIGNVKTGLSEENISRGLNTRVHFSSFREGIDHEMGGTCIICQLEYENEEKVGILECGHEYHADCIKQWLILKNVCPICKMPALTMEGMDDG